MSESAKSASRTTAGADRAIDISVVITAAWRREFLRAAVESALDQTFSRERFEIIVSKDFRDSEVDAFLAQHGVRVMGNNPPDWGRSAGNAIEVALGEVICFLDDDDLFESTKLARVWEVFSKDPRVVYYHNSLHWIDRSGAPLGREMFRQPSRLIVCDGVTRRTLRNVRRFNGDMNNSAISIRRTALLRALDPLARVRANHDRFLLLSTTGGDARIVLDSLRLTRYRVHSNPSHISQHAAQDDPRVAKFWKDQVASNLQIAAMLAGQPGAQLIAGDVAVARAQQILSAGRRDAFDPRVLVVLARSLNADNLFQNIVLASSLVLLWVAPDVARSVYVRHRHQPIALRIARRL